VGLGFQNVLPGHRRKMDELMALRNGIARHSPTGRGTNIQRFSRPMRVCIRSGGENPNC